MPGSPDRTSFTPGRVNVSPSDTQGGSRVPELGSLGSVRGALSNGRPYRDLARDRTTRRFDYRRPRTPCLVPGNGGEVRQRTSRRPLSLEAAAALETAEDCQVRL